VAQEVGQAGSSGRLRVARRAVREALAIVPAIPSKIELCTDRLIPLAPSGREVCLLPEPTEPEW